VVPDELDEVKDSGLLGQVDLLGLNIEEAATLGGVPAGEAPVRVVEAAIAALAGSGSPAQVVVTAGSRGSWSWDGRTLAHAPGVDPGGQVVSTAGAGDAHLAGIVVGLMAGLDLAAANGFAALVSALKVTSPHTINPDIDPRSVVEAAFRRGLPLPESLVELLDEALA
jgi:sugar/nucleoside kinase (ribokinase family)